MGLTELFIIAVGLSMDAFAVSVCKGLSVQKMSLGHALICGVYFGGFQALMPAIGYLLGSQFEAMITQIDHWIAFVLLAVIGGNMIKESRECEAEKLDSSFAPAAMLPLAVATSIDALAVGVTFAFLQVNIFWGRFVYRRRDLPPFCRRSPGWPCVWGKIQIQGGAGRRADPDPYGDEDPLRTPGDPGLKAAGGRRDTDGAGGFPEMQAQVF